MIGTAESLMPHMGIASYRLSLLTNQLESNWTIVQVNAQEWQWHREVVGEHNVENLQAVGDVALKHSDECSPR